jgi:hypothetical protein
VHTGSVYAELKDHKHKDSTRCDNLADAAIEIVLTACNIMHTSAELDLATSQLYHHYMDLALALALGTLLARLKLQTICRALDGQGMSSFDVPLAGQ